MQTPINLNKRILIPVNFSKASLNLFDYGLELCSALNKSMMLLYVNDLSGFDSLNGYYQRNDNELKNKLQKTYITRAQKRHSNVPVYIAIKGGDTLDKTIKATKLKEIDQILISTGLKTGLKAILYDNIEQIMKEADCSILLLPEDIAYRPFKHFLYVTDYKKADELKLKRLIKLAKYYDAKVTLIHVTSEINSDNITNHKHYTDFISNQFKYKKLTFDLLEDKNVVSKIYQHASKIKADAIVTLKKDKSLLQKIFEQSITKELALKIKLPTLIFHEKIN